MTRRRASGGRCASLGARRERTEIRDTTADKTEDEQNGHHLVPHNPAMVGDAEITPRNRARPNADCEQKRDHEKEAGIARVGPERQRDRNSQQRAESAWRKWRETGAKPQRNG